ncbi:MAG: secondary thiamine-phosphate synthase enzyme YjbQ [Marinilabiliaceae bacterium]|nr:secondary thiamine-phosphate synthase enzyme YjbQ [Marinilabiliaceae bacterium]
MIQQKFIKLPEMARGIHLITSYIEAQLGKLPNEGLLNIFLQHTSAAITLNENADPLVRKDLNLVLDKLAPEGRTAYLHDMEGLDDMPAHAKSSLVGQSITIPIANGRIALGMWQGIYFCEFRNYGGPRNLVLTICS